MTVINTNVPALTAQRNLTATGAAIQKSVERLSSGLRINRAGDDAAGLSISEKLRAQYRGLNQAVRNALDGVSMIQTAEGALSEYHAVLQRMRELSVQAASGHLSASDRDAVQIEMSRLAEALGKITENTTFNRLRLLTGNLSVSIALGTINSTNANLLIKQIDLASAKAGTPYTLTVNTGTGEATYAGGGVTQTISVRSMLANDSQVLSFSAIGIKIQVNSIAALTATQVLNGLSGNFTTALSEGSTFIQLGADAGTSNQLTISFGEISPGLLNLTSPDVSSSSAAQIMIGILDVALDTVSTQRANLGGQQNSLEHTINYLQVASENLRASESRIRDLDVAAATVDFTKSQILQQAGIAVLAQANSLPQSVLRLLQ